jgi:hypothetical protein
MSSNSSTNPANTGTSSFAGGPISFGIGISNPGTGISASFPTFTFEVTNGAYYYSFMQTAASGTLTGTYVLLVRTLSIVRVG